MLNLIIAVLIDLDIHNTRVSSFERITEIKRFTIDPQMKSVHCGYREQAMWAHEYPTRSVHVI